MSSVSMKYLMILPVAILVALSQLIVKLRASSTEHFASAGLLKEIARFVSDPVILFAYGMAFMASLGWLYVVTKLPLSIAFPIYMATTFLFVLLSGWLFLGEAMSVAKIVAVLLILGGIALALLADTSP